MWRSNDVEALGCLSDALRDEDCGVLPLEWALWARLRPARYLRVMDDRRPPLSVRSRRRTRRAGRCSPPHGAAAGCRSSAAAENAYFLTESGCESVGNIPTFREFPARKSLPSFVTKRRRQKCPQGTSVGIGQRLSLSDHEILRLSHDRSGRSILCPICCLLRCNAEAVVRSTQRWFIPM